MGVETKSIFKVAALAHENYGKYQNDKTKKAIITIFGKGWANKNQKKKRHNKIKTLAYLGLRVHNARIFNLFCFKKFLFSLFLPSLLLFFFFFFFFFIHLLESYLTIQI